MTSTHDIQEEQMTAEALTDVKASTNEASSRGPRSLDTSRLLGCSGLRISPMALGIMTFGTDRGWGADKDESKRLFDAYVERGGNFLDTANNYTNGTSEQLIGQFARDCRDPVGDRDQIHVLDAAR